MQPTTNRCTVGMLGVMNGTLHTFGGGCLALRSLGADVHVLVGTSGDGSTRAIQKFSEVSVAPAILP